MSADITPADLAKFAHRAPVGAVIPARTEHVTQVHGPYKFSIESSAYDIEIDDRSLPRWTVEPILTPEQQRLEREYAAACEAIHAAERAAANARQEAEALRPRAESLYRELQKVGRR